MIHSKGVLEIFFAVSNALAILKPLKMYLLWKQFLWLTGSHTSMLYVRVRYRRIASKVYKGGSIEGKNKAGNDKV